MNFTKILQCDSTAEWTKQLIAQMKPYPYLADILVLLSNLLIGATLSFVLFFFLQHVLIRFYRRFCTLSAELLRCVRNMAFCLVACLPIYIVGYCTWVEGIHEWVAILTRNAMEGLLVVSLALALTYGIRSFGLWYKQQRNAQQRPIDGLLGLAVGFVWTAAVILVIAVVLNKNPIYFLSGLGAMAAVLMLILQPTILSLVASIRVNTNHLVEIGDWIVMDANGVDGEVEEITLHTLKVRNWDKTLVCLPVCDLVNKPFVNYTAMQKSGGRRIKVALLIDQRSIRFLDKNELNTLKGFDILKDYLDGKEEEITQYNTGHSRFNTRHLSNLGTFRVYAQHYLEHNPNIRQDLSLVVRELAPTPSGIPLEIYCFSKEVTWKPYERVRSNIIEHLLAVLPSFRLRVFQSCSDIHQSVGDQDDTVGAAFRFDHLQNPPYYQAGARD